uniref:Uncharacterized protein n=1 Tax=Panagrolaimus davidi TaxID=227884 RepID=A0A914QRR1_9BILA
MLKFIIFYSNFLIPLILCNPSLNHQKNPHHSLKSSLIAEHSRKTHKDFRLQNEGESNSIENILQTVETFAQRSHRRAFEDAAGQDSQRIPIPMPPLSDEEETLNSLDDKKNPFLVPNFDESYKTHSICEEWNSGQQGNNVNLEWTESADRLLKIIGNGVVKNGYNMFMAPGASLRVPTNVSVAVYIESMSSFRAQTMDYEVDMYLAMGIIFNLRQIKLG